MTERRCEMCGDGLGRFRLRLHVSGYCRQCEWCYIPMSMGYRPDGWFEMLADETAVQNRRIPEEDLDD